MISHAKLQSFAFLQTAKNLHLWRAEPEILRYSPVVAGCKRKHYPGRAKRTCWRTSFVSCGNGTHIWKRSSKHSATCTLSQNLSAIVQDRRILGVETPWLFHNVQIFQTCSTLTKTKQAVFTNAHQKASRKNAIPVIPSWNTSLTHDTMQSWCSAFRHT